MYRLYIYYRDNAMSPSFVNLLFDVCKLSVYVHRKKPEQI